MGNLGGGELLLILIVVLLIFGSSKLPALGDAIGRSIQNFKSSSREPPGTKPPDQKPEP